MTFLKRYGVPEYELTNITRKISFRDTLTLAYEKNMSFRQIINSKLEYQKAFEIAKKIEGNPRQTSIHAAGVVMSDNDLTEHIPLLRSTSNFLPISSAQAFISSRCLLLSAVIVPTP